MKKIKKISFLLVCLFAFIGITHAEETKESLMEKIAPNNKLTINGVKPSSCDEVEWYLSNIIKETHNDIDLDDEYLLVPICVSDDVTKINIELGKGVVQPEGYILFESMGDPIAVDVIYNEPSEEDKKVVENVLKKLKVLDEDKQEYYEDIYENSYHLDDMNLIGWLKSRKEGESSFPTARALNYAKETVEITNGANISYRYSIGMGIEADERGLWQFNYGDTTVFNNGYAFANTKLGIFEINRLYVDKNATDFAAAAQKRIRDFLLDDTATVVLGGTLDSLNYTDEDNIEYKWDDYGIIDSDKLVDNNYYKVTINGNTYNFVLYAGESKDLVEPTFLGSDIKTSVSIKSTDKTIPLDTTVTVTEVKNDTIKKAVDTDEYLAYDITLFSKSLNKKIVKLENGKFQVSIPVPSFLSDKKLTIYYVNEKGEKVEHKVTIENGYATFETDHFSTYVLVEKLSTEVPDTYDNLNNYILLGLISIVGLSVSTIYLKKKESK